MRAGERHPEGRKAWLINRDFRLLLAGQAVSLIGDTAFDTTLLLWIGTILLKGSPLAPLGSSLPLVVAAGVTILIGPLAGVFVDRWDKRRTMLRADLIRAALIGVVTVLATIGRDDVGPAAAITVVGVTVAATTATSLFFGPARFVLIGDVVPQDQRGKASSYGQAILALAGVTGPPLAAVLLFSAGPQWAFGLNAVSFLVSYVLIRAVPAPAPAAAAPRAETGASLREEFADGLRAMAGNAVVRSLLTAVVVGTLGTGAFKALDVYFVQENLHASPAWFGYLSGVFGAGALAGALTGGVLGDRLGHARVFTVSMFALGTLIAVYSRLTGIAAAVVVVALFSFALGSLNAVAFPLILRSVPREFLGRTMSVFNPVNRLATMVSIGVASALTSTVLDGFSAEVAGLHFGRIDTVFLVSGLLVVAASLYALHGMRGTDTTVDEAAPAPASV